MVMGVGGIIGSYLFPPSHTRRPIWRVEGISGNNQQYHDCAFKTTPATDSVWGQSVNWKWNFHTLVSGLSLFTATFHFAQRRANCVDDCYSRICARDNSKTTMEASGDSKILRTTQEDSSLHRSWSFISSSSDETTEIQRKARETRHHAFCFIGSVRLAAQQGEVSNNFRPHYRWQRDLNKAWNSAAQKLQSLHQSDRAAVWVQADTARLG